MLFFSWVLFLEDKTNKSDFIDHEMEFPCKTSTHTHAHSIVNHWATLQLYAPLPQRSQGNAL